MSISKYLSVLCTIDPHIWLHHLHHVFGIVVTLSWFNSFQTNSFKWLLYRITFWPSWLVLWCTPQDYVRWLILFILYTQLLTHVILNHSVSHMLYADDTQVYKSCNANDLASSILCVEKCVSGCCLTNSEPLPEFMNINGTCVKFCPSLRNLGVTLDSTLSLHQHVLNICKSAILELRLINFIRNFLSTDAVKTLVCSLVLSRIDYWNSLLAVSS